VDSGFKILGINHVGLAPKNPAQTRTFFSDLLSLAFHGDELVKEQKTLTSMFSSLDAGLAQKPEHKHAARLEVLEPHEGTGPIAAFLDKKGSGIHHIALTVDSVDKALAWMKARGVRMIDDTPRTGAHNTRIVFIHPEATGGLLVELVEESGH
jgi:methylmalonyl-CoA/ethylmalonyl-CoA epimerase